MCYLQKDSEGFVLQDCVHGTCADCGWPAASYGRVRQLVALCCLFWVCKIHLLFLTPFIRGGSTLISPGTHNDTPLLVNFPQVWKVVISCYCYMHASWSFFSVSFFNSTLTLSGLGGSTRRREKMPESAFHGLIMWFTTFYFVIYLLIS